MREVLSIEEFYKIKDEINSIIMELNDSTLDYDKMSKEESNRILENSFNRIYTEEKKLENHDLSKIPYEAWEDFCFFSDEGHRLDLSGTGANIDFDFVDNYGLYYGNICFKGCNLKNIESIPIWSINADDYDKEILGLLGDVYLSNQFDDEFMRKYDKSELTLDDLAKLSDEQIEELDQKKLLNSNRLKSYNSILVNDFGLKKVVELYRDYPLDYKALDELYRLHNFSPLEKFEKRMEDISPEVIKEEVYNNIRKQIVSKVNIGSNRLNVDNYTDDFKQANQDIFLLNAELPEEVKERYYNRELTIEDVLTYKEVFQHIPLDNFIGMLNSSEYHSITSFLKEKYSSGEIQKLIFKYEDDFVKTLEKLSNYFFYMKDYFKDGLDIVENVEQAIRNYILQDISFLDKDESGNYQIPDYLQKMNFNIVDEIDSFEDVLKINDRTISTNPKIASFIKNFNIDYLKRLDEETGLLSKNIHMSYYGSFIFSLLEYDDSKYSMMEDYIDFRKDMSYEQFENGIANLLDRYRILRRFRDGNDYDWIEGNFRERHPEIFISKDAPDDLRKQFYSGRIDVSEFLENPKYFEYIKDKDLSKIIDLRVNLSMLGRQVGTDPNQRVIEHLDFIKEYTSRYGNEKFIEILLKYGEYLDYLVINNYENQIEDEKAIELEIIKAIYKDLSIKGYDYRSLKEIPEFVAEYPKIFVDFSNLTSIPEEERTILENDYYLGRFNLKYLIIYPELLKYFKDKELKNGIRQNQQIDIYSVISEKFGNEKLLEFIKKYNGVISMYSNKSKRIITKGIDSITSYEDFEKIFRKNVYEDLLKGIINEYLELSKIPEFIEEYPDIFINLDDFNIFENDKRRIISRIYTCNLSYDDLKDYPELINILKEKNIFVFMKIGYKLKPFFKKYVEKNGKEELLLLLSRYGHFLWDIEFKTNEDLMSTNIKELQKYFDKIIEGSVLSGEISYSPDDAPDFIKEKHPELFLDDDAPDLLKECFYHKGNYPFDFEFLSRNKDFLSSLQGKNIIPAIILSHMYITSDLKRYFELFGYENGIKLGVNRTETVEAMINASQVDLMKSWYDKTGGKFIPDFVVMQNFSLEEADKFLASGVNWSKLMKISSFARKKESREAMLKLAYSFGAFDQDQIGFKKLQELLTDLPRHISPDYSYVINAIDNMEDFVNERTVGTIFSEPIGYQNYLKLKEMLVKEGFKIIPGKEVFTQIYRKNEDGSYSLTINPQRYPKSAQIIRGLLDGYGELPILTPDKAHQLFGGFSLIYDEDFREFLLANMDKIMENAEYATFISSIQNQFSDIKAINSNRSLTMELAVSYVQTNKYTSNVGNERVSIISSIAGYDQATFDILQQIYNYGKQRTFSSIPRIEQSLETKTGRYTYEILRLDDPLAMAVGTLTNCCQRYGDCAEVCMEHSMVNQNGRVFVIKNEKGEIVAQSWVWRNKDVLCFDNIEVPKQKIWDSGIPRNRENDGIRNQFTDDILSVYQKAARELIEEDEKVFEELLESGKITQEQYDGLRLGKVTTGEGYSKIKGSLRTIELDKGKLSRPLEFKEPVKLTRNLYLDDSETRQYILAERDDRKEYDGDTLPVHSDTYVEYTDSNFNEKDLLSLRKLEIVTKENPGYLDTSVDNVESKQIITGIARNYGLNPETTKIIMNPNFAIIYDVDEDIIKVGDLLFNTKVDNEEQQMDIEKQVVMQMRLALEQIARGKEIDISSLNKKQREMYAKITGLTEEKIDKERGVGFGR